LVVDLLAAGVQPDPADGWLVWVAQRVVAALDTHQPVSVWRQPVPGTTTGVWPMTSRPGGVRVLRVWVSAPQNRSRCNDWPTGPPEGYRCRRNWRAGSMTRPPSRRPAVAWTCGSTLVNSRIRRRWSRCCGACLGGGGRLRCSRQPVQEQQRAGQPQSGPQEVGAPLVAGMQMTAADQPPKGRLDHPAGAVEAPGGLGRRAGRSGA
jgi:hypothetical protein